MTAYKKYARDGDRWYHSEVSEPAEGAVSESIVCFDGKQAFTYSKEASYSHPEMLQIHDSQEQPIISPEFLLGRRIRGLKNSLPGLMGSASPEQLLSLSQTKIMVKGFLKQPSKVSRYFDITCTFDPDRDFLPSEIRVEYSGISKAEVPSHKNWHQTWKTLEFAQVLDELTNENRWFPVKGQFVQGTVTVDGEAAIGGPVFELNIKNIRINAKLDDSLFDPAG